MTQSGAGCALEIVAKPIPRGAGRLSVVNETNLRVSFELFRRDPEPLSGQPGDVLLVQREVGPGASGTITDNFTTGSAYWVACFDYVRPSGGFSPLSPPGPGPFAQVGPIVVP
ncbi:MAG: hypothetical protein L0206_09355 [Actinobacteria bacterium]|nr:hypothetical protein [Actinomycetota bacterium]